MKYSFSHWVLNEAATKFEGRFSLENEEGIPTFIGSSSSSRDNLSAAAPKRD